MIKLVTARIKLRDDDGPTGQLSDPVTLIEYKGTYYPLALLTSVPGLHSGQLAFEEEVNPYLASESRQQLQVSRGY